jgi:hypothetical protein
MQETALPFAGLTIGPSIAVCLEFGPIVGLSSGRPPVLTRGMLTFCLMVERL